MARILFEGVVFEGVGFSEFEGKTYYNLQINGGVTNFKYSIDEMLYHRMHEVPAGTLVSLVLGTEVSKATATIHSTKKVTDVIIHKSNK